MMTLGSPVDQTLSIVHGVERRIEHAALECEEIDGRYESVKLTCWLTGTETEAGFTFNEGLHEVTLHE